MNFNRKDVITGFLIIFVLIASYFIYKKVKTPKVLPTSTPVSVEYRQDFEDSFRIDLPEDENIIELKDVSGGDSRGVATKSEILVDANDPENGYFYQGWADIDGKLTSLGILTTAKGGWLLDFNSSLEGASRIIVSLETKLDDALEKKILEGSF